MYQPFCIDVSIHRKQPEPDMLKPLIEKNLKREEKEK